VVTNRLNLPQLCLVTDPALPDLVARVEEALVSGVTMLHLRGHGVPAARFYELALQLRPRCLHHGALFIVNDRLDVGLAVGADGFQLGRRGLPLAVVRQIAGADAMLGASVHSLEEARNAVSGGADFLLAGTIFPSPSHPGEETAGPALVRTIKHSFPATPVLAIGGITVATAGQAMAAGADGVAVVSAILHAEQVSHSVEALRHEIGL